MQAKSPSLESGTILYGSGRIMVPAGTNLALNPSFEKDTNADGC